MLKSLCIFSVCVWLSVQKWASHCPAAASQEPLEFKSLVIHYSIFIWDESVFGSHLQPCERTNELSCACDQGVTHEILKTKGERKDRKDNLCAHSSPPGILEQPNDPLMFHFKTCTWAWDCLNAVIFQRLSSQIHKIQEVESARGAPVAGCALIQMNMKQSKTRQVTQNKTGRSGEWGPAPVGEHLDIYCMWLYEAAGPPPVSSTASSGCGSGTVWSPDGFHPPYLKGVSSSVAFCPAGFTVSDVTDVQLSPKPIHLLFFLSGPVWWRLVNLTYVERWRAPVWALCEETDRQTDRPVKGRTFIFKSCHTQSHTWCTLCWRSYCRHSSCVTEALPREIQEMWI